MSEGEVVMMLSEAGYAVVVTTLEVRGHDEVWEDRGESFDEALAAALAKMLPSHLARTVLDAPVPSALLVTEPVEALEATVASTTTDHEPDDTPDEAWYATQEDDSARIAEVRADLEALDQEVAGLEALDFPLFAPQVMRLQMLAWTAYARDLGDRAKDPGIERALGRVTARVSKLGRDYWPGAVEALKKGCTPEQAARALNLSLAHERPSWWDVGEAAEAEFARSTSAPRDVHGWSDTAALPPPPTRPTERFETTLVELDAAFSEFEGAESKASVPTAVELKLVGAARVLRWVRTVVDPRAWGRAMGRLRRAAHERELSRLAAVLRPDYVPPGLSWFRELGSRQAKTPVRVAPLPAEVTLESLVEWLRTEGVRLDGPTLRGQVGVHAALLEGAELTALLPGPDFRSLRRKLDDRRSHVRTVQTALEEQTPAEVAPDDAGLVPEEPGPVERARALIKGRKVLLVTNRDDSLLRGQLEEAFGIELEIASVEHIREVQNAAERVGKGSYDLVFLATSFMCHKSEAVIARGAEGTPTKLLRVGKGRTLACAQAVLTHFQ